MRRLIAVAICLALKRPGIIATVLFIGRGFSVIFLVKFCGVVVILVVVRGSASASAAAIVNLAVIRASVIFHRGVIPAIPAGVLIYGGFLEILRGS